jgi:hypothetical protein
MQVGSILKEYAVIVEDVHLARVLKYLPTVVTVKAPCFILLSFSPMTVRLETIVTVEGESRSSGTVEAVDGGYLYHMVVGELGDHRLIATIEFLDESRRSMKKCVNRSISTHFDTTTVVLI